MLNQPSIVIIIDVWNRLEDGRIPTSPLPDNILNFLNRTGNLHTAVLASYYCRDEIHSDHLWYRNHKAMFGHRSEYDEIMLSYQEYEYKDFNYATHKKILDYVNPDIFQISMRQQRELEIYLGMHPEIKNIYVAGEAWEICVKDRPLGWSNVREKFTKNTDLNLLVNVDTVNGYNDLADVANTPGWHAVSPKVYKFTP